MRQAWCDYNKKPKVKKLAKCEMDVSVYNLS